MDILAKLQILSGAARYDASCSSSGSKREGPAGGTGNTSSSGICHSWADDGRCISLLKILLSNDCQYDCAYCVNRSSNVFDPKSAWALRHPEFFPDAMNRYLYDGTADGLLSAISWILEEEPDPEQVTLAEREDTLFEDGFFLATDATQAEDLFFRLRKQASDAAHTLYSFMLAEKEGMESSLLHYIALAFIHGDKVNGYLTHPSVRDIVGVAKKASRELHRMKGLLRFEKLQDGAYLAKMEPDTNIIQPLAYHFSRRLRAQHWFLYDVRRRIAARWNQGTLQFGTIEQFTAPALSDDEKKVQVLWQTFFKTIAIPDRKNPRLQKSNMPMKYWKYLTEKQGE